MERLSNSERLVIFRRRRRENQAEAAKRHGVSHFKYGQWERAKELSPFQPSTDGLEDHEKCFIHRRRRFVSQSHVASLLGRSPRWINMMERGEVTCKELLDFWKTQE